MQGFRLIFTRYFLAGLIIFLPLVILGIFFRWLFHTLTDLIQPFTNLVIKLSGFPELAGDVIVILLILISVALTGYLVTTSAGIYLHNRFDATLNRLATGYQMIKEIVNQFVGDKASSPFAGGSIARVKLCGEQVETTVTAIITSRHDDGTLTVFVPTGPNPTSGFIYQIPEHLAEIRPDIKVEAAMKTVISCGAGSAKLFAPAPPDTSNSAPHVAHLSSSGHTPLEKRENVDSPDQN